MTKKSNKVKKAPAKMKFNDIPQMTKFGGYNVHSNWDYVFDTLQDWNDRTLEGSEGVDLDPDFQRGHVWNEEKQRRYVEYVLRGGHSSKDIYFNHPGWQGDYKGLMVLVDGKQRLEAVRKFMLGELAIFDGRFLKDFSGRLPLSAYFNVHVNSLKTRKEVLQWYIDLNDGGVAHTSEEILKVKALLEKEAKGKIK